MLISQTSNEIERPNARSNPGSFILIQNKSISDKLRILIELVLASGESIFAAPSWLLYLSIYVVFLTAYRFLYRDSVPRFAPYIQSTVLYPIQLTVYLWLGLNLLALSAFFRVFLLYTSPIGDAPARIFCLPPSPSDLSVNSSLLRLLVCCWNTPLLFKSRNQRLEFDDVPELEESMTSYTIASENFRVLWPWVLAQLVLGISGAILTVLPSYFVNCILRYIEVDTSGNPYWYVAGIGASIVLAGTVSTQGEYFGIKLSKAMEANLLAKVYKKALMLKSGAGTDSGAIISLIVVDVSKLAFYSAEIHCLISNPFVVIAGIYYLYNLLGVSAFAGIGVMLLSFPLNWTIGSRLASYEDKIASATDERINKTSELLNTIRVIKYFAWENKFSNSLLETRAKELRLIWKKRVIYALSGFLLFCLPLAITAASFVCYVLVEGKPISSSIAFTSMAIFNIFRHPLDQLLQTINIYKQFDVSRKRLQKFLASKETPKRKALKHVSSKFGFQNATLMWSDSSVCLKNVTADFTPGLSVIVGPTGSGKTALLLGLLGELTVKSGIINSPPSLSRSTATIDSHGCTNTIAYCPQQAWIVNDTIKNNILFASSFDALRYEQVIRACELEKDFKDLSYGDGTVVGIQGINLSGGQKQRISLARALYSNSRYLLLDDCLSAVDSHTATAIYDSAITGPLTMNRTIVLVSHNVDLVISKAQSVIIMEQGVITHSGAPDKLASEDVLTAIAKTNEKSTDPKVETNHKESEIRDEEGRAVGNVSIGTYVRFVKAVGNCWWWIILGISFAAVILSEYGTNYWLKVWATAGDDAVASHGLGYYAGIYVAVFCVYGALCVMLEVVAAIGSIHLSKTVYRDTLCAVLHAKMEFFDTTPIGQVINRLSKDIGVADNNMVPSLRVLIRCILDALAVAAVISYAQPAFILIAIPVAMVYYKLGQVYLVASRELTRLSSVARSPIIHQVEESIAGAVSIRSYGDGPRYRAQCMNLVDKYTKVELNLERSNMWLAYWGNFISSVVVAIASLFVLWRRDVIGPGLAGITMSYSMLLNDSIHWSIRLFGIVQGNMNAMERLDEYNLLDQEPPYEIPESKAPRTWPSKGIIRFNNVSLGYRSDLPLVIDHISFEVQGGEKVGIVGRTGAGKSTLTSALFRFIDPISGTIEIDGIDTSTLGLYNVRKSMAIIPQDPTLFRGLLRDNLDIDNEYTDAEVEQVLVQLNLPFGLDHEISSGGSNLSQGQRQIVCLARALLTRPKILIMDEATASIDYETDEFIQATIKAKLQGVTVLTIAHRVKTVMDYDKVMVLERGKIVEFASPNQLLDNKTRFRDMAISSGIDI